MLIGREKGLNMLAEMYSSKNFRFLVMYGRHRVGKTAILREFSHKKDVIYFHAGIKNDQMGLADFSRILHLHFNKEPGGRFSDWEAAFTYLTSRLTEKRTVIIIEEFHRLVSEYPGMVGLLQRTIDRSFRTKNVFLIISDSNISFMESLMLGYDSPFYGRVTGQMVVLPLDYLDAGKLLAGYSAEDKIRAYGILGGIPGYISQFDDSLPIVDNLSRNVLRYGSFLRSEPPFMLRTQFRDPAVYNSILEAMAGGACRMNDISVRIHEESQKCSKYLNTLRTAWLVDKVTPAGEDELSKKSLYTFSDNYFWFWYRFLFASDSSLESEEPSEAAAKLINSDSYTIYIEEIFQEVCRQFIARKARAGKLPFSPAAVGRWWSGISKKKTHGDIDVVAVDKDRSAAIFGKCSFSDQPLDVNEIDELVKAARGFGKVPETYYYIFSRSGVTDEAAVKIKKNKNMKLFNIEEIFKV